MKFFSKLNKGFKIFLLVIALAIVGGGLYIFAPGLRVDPSKTVLALDENGDVIDNVTQAAFLELPSTTPSTTIQSKPRVRIAGYAWNGEQGIAVANGGPFTTKGSLMESNGVNLELIRQDWLSELKAMQMKFIEEYDKGQEFPSSDKSAMGIMIMGDGVPYYLATMQTALNDKFNGKYHVEMVGAFGMSNGEDKLIGPSEWKTNPKSMLGALISTVPGDGDWVVTLNFCGVNNLKVNPDFTTYDPDAVNFLPSADDDYMNSAKELIASQKNGFTVSLKEVIDGKLTGKTINKKVDGCATWTPGDKTVFDALTGFTDVASTADFPNQMATSLIVVKEWAATHPEIITNILKSTLTATNQMKLYDKWRVRASEAIQKTFALETPEYWYDMFKGQTGKKGGVSYSMGGTRVLSYADAIQYYGITDGKNRYKSVYNQVSNYLVELNPFGFNESVDGIVPYNDAVNLTYLLNAGQDIDNTDAGQVEAVDYTATKTEVMANGEWNINFVTGSANIQASSNRDLSTIYNLLIQAEQTKVILIGHTDNTGSHSINQPLSKDRANSVAEYLISRGISRDRIQEVRGEGDSNPITTNATADGKATNRRVQITLLR
jgi:outer membrane protein OmpA-like peptidoglycan-associated protein